MCVCDQRREVFDNASSHNILKAFFLGLTDSIPRSIRKNTEWFCDLTFQPLPTCCIPNLKYKAPMSKGSAICALNGPQHCQKNYVSGLRSSCRTVHLGELAVDAASAIHMPPPAQAGFG